MIVGHDIGPGKAKLSIVVCGWHFKRIATYNKLIQEGSLYDDLDIRYYIASHRGEGDLEQSVMRQLQNMGWEIIGFQNEGWDWGAYQQFIKWQKANESLSDYYLFLHDDIIIKKHYFIKAFLSEVSKGAKVIGNGFPCEKPMERAWPGFSAHVLLWAKMQNFFIRSKSWKCTRGSCFFTTREVVNTIIAIMPIKHGPHVGLGNWSAILFGGLIADRFGVNAVSYLGNTLRNSPYLLEEYRGGIQETILYRFRLYAKSIIPFRVIRLLKGHIAPLPPATGLKLHLGSGSRYVDGYLNIDVASDIADLKVNFVDLRLMKESASAVFISHIVKGITYPAVESLLEKIFFSLKKEGQLIIEFPLSIKKIQGNLKSPDNINAQALKRLLLEIGFNKICIEPLQFGWLLKSRDTRIVAIK